MQIQYVKGNILNVKADAMVLPANRALKEGSGVSTAIFQAAGRRKLTEACKKIGSCAEGNAVITLAYDLDADYIVHAVVPKWEDGNHGEYDRLCAAYLAALKAADIAGRETIAFPLLGSGNNGYDLELALEIAIKPKLSTNYTRSLLTSVLTFASDRSRHFSICLCFFVIAYIGIHEPSRFRCI